MNTHLSKPSFIPNALHKESLGEMTAKSSTNNLSSQNLEMVRKLENFATFCQNAIKGSGEIIRILRDIQSFMKDLKMKSSENDLPDSVVQNFLETQLSLIRSTVNQTRFKGKLVLGGDYCPKILVEGNKLKFVKALYHLNSEKMERLPVQIFRMPTQSELSGSRPLSNDLIDQETSVALVEGNKFLKYSIKNDETAESFIQNFQSYIDDHGFGITVTLNKNNHLSLIHNQYGSNYIMSALSESTDLISDIPGELKSCKVGLDIQGSIGEEKLIGQGKFLIGNAKSKKIPGLVIFLDGQTGLVGETAGYITVKPMANEHIINEGLVDYHCLPPLYPENLSIGVENKSNILNLSEIRGTCRQSISDSIVIIQWAIEDIEILQSQIRTSENQIIDQTLNLLKEFMISPKNHSDSLLNSKEKAEEMSLVLQNKLTKRKPLMAI